jgi:hypothetical protein
MTKTRRALARTVKGRLIHDALSSGAHAALFPDHNHNPALGRRPVLSKLFRNGVRSFPGLKTPPRFRPGDNVFVNDPCLDPPPPDVSRTVQSETEIAVLETVPRGRWEDDEDDFDQDRRDYDRWDGDHDGWDGDHDRRDGDHGRDGGRLMVAGYNDTFGREDSRQGYAGFSYSTNGGRTWIDGGGLPQRIEPVFAVPADFAWFSGSDAFFGEPSVAVHHRTKSFFYASVYRNEFGNDTVSVSRGEFKVAPPQGPESNANSRCEGDIARDADPPSVRERIIWDPPVQAITQLGPFDEDFFDRPWLHVDQKTGTLYLTYTRFTLSPVTGEFETPLELMRSDDGGVTWTGPTVIAPNVDDVFNQAPRVITTPPTAKEPRGRVIVTWFSYTFVPATLEILSERIESTYSTDDGETFPQANRRTVSGVKPQGEPLGANTVQLGGILNAPYIAVDRGADDGSDTKAERRRRGFGDVYVAYFSGKGDFAFPYTKAADIFVSRSRDGGTTWDPRVKVNTDSTFTSHVFPSVQVNRHGLVYMSWLDRRRDPQQNVLTDTWAAALWARGQWVFGNTRVSDVSTSWYVRADGPPPANFGLYNSSTLINFERYATIWADGRFPEGPPAGPTTPPEEYQQTPDTIFAEVPTLPLLFGFGDDD